MTHPNPDIIAATAPTPADEREEMPKQFRRELESLINRQCMENGSDTPDFILAGYMAACLDAFDAALKAREKWYGREVGEWNPASN